MASCELYPYGLDDGSAVWLYPGAIEGGTATTLISSIFRIRPDNGDPWFANVERASDPEVFLMPDLRSFLISGEYHSIVIDSSDPQNWTELQVYPLRFKLWSEDRSMALFGDWTSLELFDQGGRRWSSECLVMDSIGVEKFGADKISVSGYDATKPGDGDCYLEIDTRTGRKISKL